jgi:hypothetical protein
MPRFFDVESSDDEESDQDVEVESKATPAKRGARSVLANISDDEDEVTEKRVVRSQKEKKAEELQDTFKSIRNKVKANDWNTGVAGSFSFRVLMTSLLPPLSLCSLVFSVSFFLV